MTMQTQVRERRAPALSRVAPWQPPEPGRRRFRSDRLRRRLLALTDGAATALGCLVLGLVAGQQTGFWALAALPVWLVLAKLHGLYDRDHRSLRHLTVDEASGLFVWSVTGTTATILLLYLAPPRAPAYASAAAMVGAVVTSAFLLRIAARALWRALTPPERALLVGSGPLAEMTRRKLRLFTDMHIAAVGQRPAVTAEEVRRDRSLLDGIDRVLVAATPLDDELVAELVRACRERGVKLSVIPPTGAFGTAVQLTRVADLPIVEYNTWDISRSTLVLKRLLDVALSALALAALTPLLTLTALAAAIDSRGAPIFVQRRAGLLGRPFRMLKFRTMVADAEERLAEVVSIEALDKPMFKVPRDPRVTRFGSLLRRTSLDELPQLVNVLKGDMSLVGPRPEQVELVARYHPEHRFRLVVKPGLTGPMQVFGRGELTFDERLAVERDYIENLTIGRDLRILAMTIAAVAGGRGAY
jgi:exopolysaccharide biosynthesis polyprenyl glycosylphosphotransferase